jgi:hypothetical protein
LTSVCPSALISRSSVTIPVSAKSFPSPSFKKL